MHLWLMYKELHSICTLVTCIGKHSSFGFHLLTDQRWHLVKSPHYPQCLHSLSADQLPYDCSCSGKINQCVNSLISVGGLQKQHNTSVKHGKFSGFYKDTILNLVAAMFCESFYNSIECGSGTVCANST